MTDLTTKTNDELAAGLHDHIVEAEGRATGFTKRLLQIAHRALDEAQRKAHADGEIATLSGDDKDN
jgi:hypothetical protein